MKRQRNGEQGYFLVGLIVACFLMVLALTVAAPLMVRQLRREREVETTRRANQYVRAIRVYYRKFGHYPGSIEQLEKTNNIRFLRQRYVDPLTGKDDWRLIHVGENKTQVKGFFGEPLTGLPTSGMGGSSIGNSPMGNSPMGSSNSTSGGSSGGFTSFGSTLLGGSGGTPTGNSGATSTPGTGTTPAAGGTPATGNDPFFGTPGATGTAGTGSGNGTGSGSGSDSGFGSNVGGGPIMGIGLNHPGDAIVVVNEQTTYDTWEFLYDPRSEPKPNMGGGIPTSGGSSNPIFGGTQNGTNSNSGPGSTNGGTSDGGFSTGGTNGGTGGGTTKP